MASNDSDISKLIQDLNVILTVDQGWWDSFSDTYLNPGTTREDFHARVVKLCSMTDEEFAELGGEVTRELQAA